MSCGPGADPDAAHGRGALAGVAPYLRCPVCRAEVRLGEGQVSCARGHGFNVARQGYVSLVGGQGGPGTGDSAPMVMARERFLSAGHYQPIAAAVAECAAKLAAPLDPGRPVDPGKDGLVVDLAGGTGYYLAAVLDALDALGGRSGPGGPGGPLGVCVDLSAPALRRAARAHPRAAAVGADAWAPLPLADASAAVLLSVFGPRNAAEIGRVLAPGGALVVCAPGPEHLREPREALGLIGIDERKGSRLAGAFGGLAAVDPVPVRYQLRLDQASLHDLVAMGPNARHLTTDDLASRIAALPDPFPITVNVIVSAFLA